MASALKISNAAAQARAAALAAAIDAGTAAVIEIYDGSQPADVDTAVGAQVKLATLTMSASAFGSPADANPHATITAAAITSDSSADATGTASWFRIKTQAGGTAVLDGSVGTSGCDLNVNSVAFAAGAIVAISSMVLTDREYA